MRNPRRSKKKDWKRTHYITESVENLVIKFKKPTFLVIKGIKNGYVKCCTFQNVKLPIKLIDCKYFLLDNNTFATKSYKGKVQYNIPDIEIPDCNKYELEY